MGREWPAEAGRARRSMRLAEYAAARCRRSPEFAARHSATRSAAQKRSAKQMREKPACELQLHLFPSGNYLSAARTLMIRRGDWIFFRQGGGVTLGSSRPPLGGFCRSG